MLLKIKRKKKEMEKLFRTKAMLEQSRVSRKGQQSQITQALLMKKSESESAI